MVDVEGNILEIALQPEPAHYIGHFLAGNGNLHALDKAGEGYYLVGAEVVVAVYGDVTHDVFFRVVVIYLHTAFLGLQSEGKQKSGK